MRVLIVLIFLIPDMGEGEELRLSTNTYVEPVHEMLVHIRALMEQTLHFHNIFKNIVFLKAPKGVIVE